MSDEELRCAYKVSLKSILINFTLFVLKGIFGALVSSASLISDAIHSLTDIFSTFIVMLGIKLSDKPSDENHPYGHEKIECIVAFLLGIMLFAIGGSIGWNGIKKLINPVYAKPRPLILNSAAIIIAAVSIAAKEWMYRYTIKCAKQINSASMAADAWHHRSDALSSAGSLTGVVAIRFGRTDIDALACLIISVFIFKAAFNICADACKKLVDTSSPPETIKAIKDIIEQNKEVMSIDALKTRQYGSRIYIDLEITLDRNISFVHSHEVAQDIHDEVEKKISAVKHCMVHVNPSALVNHHHI